MKQTTTAATKKEKVAMHETDKRSPSQTKRTFVRSTFQTARLVVKTVKLSRFHCKYWRIFVREKRARQFFRGCASASNFSSVLDASKEEKTNNERKFYFLRAP